MKRSAGLRTPTRQKAGSLEEAAFLDLLRTSDLLTRNLVQVLDTRELSPTLYNVLRILRGSREGLPCGEIASRMITRDPDVTRLLDRLGKRGLISRRRDSNDRRTVLTRITAEGLRLLDQLDEPVLQAHSNRLGHLGPSRLQELAVLLQAARAPSE
jgi:DNA-binding MarR family transcriptional regulator